MIRNILLLAILYCAAKNLAAQPKNIYELDFREDRVLISAQFESCDSILYMITGSARESKIGQQALVKNLKWIDGDTTIFLTPIDKGQWKIPPKDQRTSSFVLIQYEIILDFDRFTWNAGKEEMAYRSPQADVFSMRSLFIFPLEKFDIKEAITIKFVFPEDKQLISPWNLDNLDAKIVNIPDFVEFLYNTFLIGNVTIYPFAVNDLNISMVCLDGLTEHQKDFERSLQKAAQYYSEAFGQQSGKYLIIYSRGTRNDGGAFENSFSQTILGPINEASLPFWAGLSTHELCHLWHGRDITYKGAEEEWILEGWADYFTIKALSQTSLISPEQTLDKLENSIRKYLIAKYAISPEVSLVQAGTDKNTHRMLLYGGGAISALYFDMLIQQQTKHQANLNTLMQQLFEQRKEKSFSTKDIQQILEELTNQSYSTFFEKYIKGAEFLPIETIFQQLGLQLDVFGYEDVNLTPNANSLLRKSLFGF